MGIGEFSECKVRDPLECRHALRFGYGWLCRHPQWRQFLNNALGAQGPALPPAPAEAASE